MMTPWETPAFKDVTVILPVINENYSLAQTVEAVVATSKSDLRELLIVVADKTTTESMDEIGRLQQEFGDLVVVHPQTLKFLGGAMREALISHEEATPS